MVSLVHKLKLQSVESHRLDLVWLVHCMPLHIQLSDQQTERVREKDLGPLCQYVFLHFDEKILFFLLCISAAILKLPSFFNQAENLFIL